MCFLIFWSLCFSVNSQAQGKTVIHVIVLVSAPNAKWMAERYLNAARHIETTVHGLTQTHLNQTEWRLRILAQNPGKQWIYTDNNETIQTIQNGPTQHGALSIQTIENLFAEICSQPSTETDIKQQSILILIVGHGEPMAIEGAEEEEPSSYTGTGSLYAWEPELIHRVTIRFNALKQAIEKFLDTKKNPVRILSLACFSGCIHSLSRALENVSTAATTTFLTTSFSHPNGSECNEGFLGHLGNPAVTFGNAVIAGYRNETYNDGLGALSSFDFIDFIWKEGPYHPNFIDLAHNSPQEGYGITIGEPEEQNLILGSTVL